MNKLINNHDKARGLYSAFLRFDTFRQAQDTAFAEKQKEYKLDRDEFYRWEGYLLIDPETNDRIDECSEHIDTPFTKTGCIAAVLEGLRYRPDGGFVVVADWLVCQRGFEDGALKQIPTDMGYSLDIVNVPVLERPEPLNIWL